MSSILLSSSAFGVPAVFALAGLLQLCGFKNNETRWRIAKVAALVAFAVAFFGLLRSPSADSWVPIIVMLLVTTLASVLVWFSHTYLKGMKGHARFLKAFLFTLASVGAAVATDHLGVLVLAWTMSSLFLHRLLTFFDDRPGAHLAARKKFIASRLAEVCLVAFLILIVRNVGSWDISEVSSRLASTTSHPVGIHVAGALLALAVILKTAQMPLHGWLLQVMEAPTPVSALLHAGVLNIGGYVLIRMAALISAVPAAQALLVGIGCFTAAVAGLVSMTRVSIKVRLAWSTCAQMGFMLVECGLGFYELALVHLVSHSLYKAHAFLSCGDIVRKTQSLHMTSLSQRKNMGIAFVAAAATVFFHFNAAFLFSNEMQHSNFQVGLLALVVASFLFLAVIQFTVMMKPQGRLSRVLYPWIYGGFFIDEIFTQFSNNLWILGNKKQLSGHASEGKRAEIVFSGESSC
jgi:NAD(P)H-quinone oxidoreductase subunit 5